jgi:hypothetical protein
MRLRRRVLWLNSCYIAHPGDGQGYWLRFCPKPISRPAQRGSLLYIFLLSGYLRCPCGCPSRHRHWRHLHHNSHLKTVVRFASNTKPSVQLTDASYFCWVRHTDFARRAASSPSPRRAWDCLDAVFSRSHSGCLVCIRTRRHGRHWHCFGRNWTNFLGRHTGL